MPIHEGALPARRIRELDDLATREFGIPGLVLMERAGRAAALRAAELIGELGLDGAWVVCGRGNNGGDGFVAARHLDDLGVPVFVSFLGTEGDLRPGSDAATEFGIARACGLEFRMETAEDAPLRRSPFPRPLLIDAMLGTGLGGPPRPPFDAWIERLATCGHPILALDLPSGLDADSGRPLGRSLRALETLSFGCEKAGFGAAAAVYTGRVRVVDIGWPRRLVERAAGDG